MTDRSEDEEYIRPVRRYGPRPRVRRPGGWKGRVEIADDFDDPLPEFEDVFHDSPIEAP